MNNKKELPVEEIVKEWKEGKTQEELAKKYDVSYGTISNRINSFYKEKGEERPKSKREKELPIEEIVKEWEEGTTQKELAKKHGVAYLTINDRINKYYEEKGEERTKPKREKELPVEEIVKEWKEGKTLEELVKKYGVSNSTIRNRINKFYEEKEEEKTKPKREKKLPIEEIVKKWEAGKSLGNLGKEYGVSHVTISNRINKYYEEKGEEKTKRSNKKELPIAEIVKEWEEGIALEKLAIKYTIEKKSLNSEIEMYFKQIGIRKLLRKPDIIIEYLGKGLSIEQVQEIAKKSNVYIPKFIKETAIEKTMKIDDKEEKER